MGVRIQDDVRDASELIPDRTSRFCSYLRKRLTHAPEIDALHLLQLHRLNEHRLRRHHTDIGTFASHVPS